MIMIGYKNEVGLITLVLKLLILPLTVLRPSLVWSSASVHDHAFVGIPVGRDHRFDVRATGRHRTKLHPHRFNGGYDPASPLAWTPQQAAEFTIFHQGTPQHAGMQLQTTIQHWSGADLAEFLTRLYLGFIKRDENNESFSYSTTRKIAYEPQNVRTPKWKGLDTREGILALKDLLREALSRELLSPQEIARFGEAFLLKEYRWPSQIQQLKSTSSRASFSKPRSGEIAFEKDSFYCLGHAKTFARVLLSVRKEKGCDELNWNDIALMVTLPERNDEDREVIPMELIDFFRAISAHTTLTASDKANIVQRMAISGWTPGSIPRFIAALVSTEKPSENHVLDEMSRLHMDAFFDFPCAATISDIHTNGNGTEISAIDTATAKVANIVGKRDGTFYSKRSRNAKHTERAEYDELVQSYWNKVEVETTQKKIHPAGGYGVSKTKSIKKRKLPDKCLSKAHFVVDSI
mmetsp:Transcript_21889/g.52079  ORF Transcript_21889/g.52079 Transcript_21889/m.52079 type:complete len:463 (+) Transcript_21889:64-1452(+)